jgi:hypothetical protein
VPAARKALAGKTAAAIIHCMPFFKAFFGYMFYKRSHNWQLSSSKVATPVVELPFLQY